MLILYIDQDVKIFSINDFSISSIQNNLSLKNSLGLSLNCPSFMGKYEAHCPYKVVLIKTNCNVLMNAWWRLREIIL